MGHVDKTHVISGFFGEYHFLSNFWPSNITIVGISYKNVEAAYQASKTYNLDTRREFSNLDPKAAKAHGRTIELHDGWGDMAKISSMELCLRAKFNIPHLRYRLIATHPLELIETNSWGDKFWGVSHGGGRNTLGKLLMMVRDELIFYEPSMPKACDQNYEIYTYETVPF